MRYKARVLRGKAKYMKKTVSLILALIAVITALLGLTACQDKSDIPEGMQLVRGGDELGYYFYGPDGWVISNDGDIDCTYVTTSISVSMTFVKSVMPEGYTKPVIDESTGEIPIPEWIKNYADKQLAAFPSQMLATKSEVKATDFGNASEAYRVIFDYTYLGESYKSLQAFVVYQENFYIFTYAALAKETAWIGVPYDNYLDEAELVMKNFKFVGAPKAPEATPTEPEEDWRLVSDKSLCYFNLYLPKEYSVDKATSIIAASDNDGRSVSAAEIRWNFGGGFHTYWALIKADLEAVGTDVDFTTYSEIGEDLPERIADSGLTDAIITDNDLFKKDGVTVGSTTYTYKLGGVSYKATTVLVITAFKAFNFTYVAEDGKYEGGLDTVKEIFAKMEF